MRGIAVVLCAVAACSGSGNSDQRSVTVSEPAPAAANGRPSSAPAQATVVGACAVGTYPGGACPPGTACYGILRFYKAFSAGTGPTPLAAGFLGSGHQDVVVGNSNNTVSVLLGDGTGNLGSPTGISVGVTVKDLVVADFTNDAKLDIAVATGSDVRVFVGNGNGTFQTPAKTTSVAADGLAVAQLDAGTTADLVVFTYASSVTPLIGNGDGTFTAGTSVAWTGPDVQLVAGDFNGDGHPDVAIANSGSGGIGIALNNGSGGLGTPVSSNLGAGRIAVGDVDGDGKLDIVQGTYVQVGSNNRSAAAVALGNGDGTLKAPTKTFVEGLGDLVLGDVDGDAKLDLVVTAPSTTPAAIISILFGHGDGTFDTTTQYFGATSMTRLALADMNADGRLDLLATLSSSSQVAVFLSADPTGCAGGAVAPTCNSGTTCTSTSFCTNAFASGTATCPADTQMTTAYGGTYVCCPTGLSETGCNTNDPISSCSYTGALPLPNAQGPCSDGRWCPVGTTCGGSGACYPADHPVPCGAVGCLAGAACTNGTCGCPSGEPACGDQCCGAGAQCINDKCVSSCTDSGFPTPCGDACCANGVACTAGACACPANHPVSCGATCCLAGADCIGSTCGCPGSRAPCGDVCCASGQACIAGSCEQATSVPDSGIPGCPATCTNGAPGCGYCVAGQVQCTNQTGNLCCFTSPEGTCNGTCYATASCETNPTGCGTVQSMGNPDPCDGVDQTTPCPADTQQPGMCCHRCLVAKNSGGLCECFIP